MHSSASKVLQPLSEVKGYKACHRFDLCCTLPAPMTTPFNDDNALCERLNEVIDAQQDAFFASGG
jgi:hypothetical protein